MSGVISLPQTSSSKFPAWSSPSLASALKQSNPPAMPPRIAATRRNGRVGGHGPGGYGMSHKERLKEAYVKTSKRHRELIQL